MIGSPVWDYVDDRHAGKRLRFRAELQKRVEAKYEPAGWAAKKLSGIQQWQVL